MELIKVNYAEADIEKSLDYGITKTEALDTGGVKVFFYIANTLGDKIEGDILLDTVSEDIMITSDIYMIKYVNRKLMRGDSQLVVYAADDEENREILNCITFYVSIKYDEGKGEYYPESRKINFSWKDVEGKMQSEKIRVEWETAGE